MKATGKLLAVLAAVCLLAGTVATTVSAATYAYTKQKMDVGTYELALLDTVEHTVYGFTPGAVGVYRISTGTAGVTLYGYTGNPWFTMECRDADADNTVSVECKEGYVGNTYYFGLAGDATTATVTIALDENAEIELLPADAPWTVYAPTVELADFSLNLGAGETLTYVDVTAPHTAVPGADGYYHLDSVTGEILYTNIGGTAPYIQLMTMLSTSRVGAYEYDSEGNFVDKFDYGECLNAYNAVADKGVYPMTADLIEIMQRVGTAKGWYTKGDTLGNYLFVGETIDAATGWMCTAGYLSGRVGNGLKGDMNVDGRLNSADAVYLLYHSLLGDAYPVQQSGDLNGDGSVSGADAVRLLYHSLLPGQYPLA